MSQILFLQHEIKKITDKSAKKYCYNTIIIKLQKPSYTYLRELKTQDHSHLRALKCFLDNKQRR